MVLRQISLKSLVVLALITLFPLSICSLSFTSTATNITLLAGQTATFLCSVSSLDQGQVLIWRKTIKVLVTGSMVLTQDKRFTLERKKEKYSSLLSLKEVKAEDGGDYVCQVGTREGGVVEQKHKLTVVVPPKVVPLPSNGRVTTKEGESVTLRCNATGIPKPRLAWQKSVGAVAGAIIECEGSCYTIPNISREGGGDYICSAANGIGHPSHATITLTVLCKSSNYYFFTST